MATAKKSKQGSDSSFDNGRISREQERAYKNGIYQMAQPVSRRPQLLAKTIVWGSLILIFIFVIYNAIMANANRALNSDLNDTLQTQYNPSFRVRYADLGAEIINAWYSGKPAPVNVAEGLAWNVSAPASVSATAPVAPANAAKTNNLAVTGVAFMSGNQVSTADANGSYGVRYEERLQYYALVNGVPYTIGVSIAIPNLKDINSTPTLVATPTLIGKASIDPEKTDALVNPSKQKQMVAAGVSAQALSEIDNWAKAWTEDNGSGLKSATDDPDNSHTYRGLGGGWAYVPQSAKVVWSVADPKDPKNNSIVRVTWNIKTPDTVTPADPAKGTAAVTVAGAVQQQTMDIMVGKFNQGSPSIVAWGQPGTYLDLKPYMNALLVEDAAKLPAPVQVVPGSTTAPSAPATTAPDTAESK